MSSSAPAGNEYFNSSTVTVKPARPIGSTKHVCEKHLHRNIGINVGQHTSAAACIVGFYKNDAGIKRVENLPPLKIALHTQINMDNEHRLIPL